jgi:hypothetical protein
LHQPIQSQSILERASAAGLSWPLSEDRADRLLNLNELLFPAEPMGGRPQGTGTPGLRRHSLAAQSSKYVTLQLLWKEYRQSQPEGYRYGCFCELYQCWRRKGDLVLRQDHLAGEKIFVDCTFTCSWPCPIEPETPASVLSLFLSKRPVHGGLPKLRKRCKTGLFPAVRQPVSLSAR